MEAVRQWSRLLSFHSECVVVVVVVIVVIIIIGSTALGLLKQMSSATSILGSRQPVPTTQFLCVFLYPDNPS
jgi:hypothetical protein